MRTLNVNEIKAISGAGSNDEAMENAMYALPTAMMFVAVATLPILLTSPIAVAHAAYSGAGLVDSLKQGLDYAAFGFTGPYNIVKDAYNSAPCYC